MRLQTKKLNQPLLPPGIAAVFLLSLIYWLYLSVTTRMDIIFDSISYEDLGRMLKTHGWLSYFTTGPNREPLYPLLIASSMSLSDITGLAYVKIMAFYGVIILLLTQILTYKILRLLNIRNGICILVLAYLALSPALNNAAFSLYSEIAAFPIILGLILTGAQAWEAIVQNKQQRALLYGSCLGLLLTAATLVKGVFECIALAYLIIFFSVIARSEATKQSLKNGIASSSRHGGTPRNDTITLLLCIIAAVSFFYVPINGYKWLNWRYNGNFVLTGRVSWMIYGNTTRRVEPLSLKQLAEDLAFTPGRGVCDRFFSPKECDYWTFEKSDGWGMQKLAELDDQHLTASKINDTLLYLSVQKTLQNPFQYILLAVIEGSKMFFWESTKIGFVRYPHWLQKIYNVKIFDNGLRFSVSLISFIAVVSLWLQAFVPRKPHLEFLIGSLIFIYIFLFSFVSILTRYALPIAPLYLISIGIWINKKL